MNTEIKKKLDDLRQDNSSGASELINKSLHIIRSSLENVSEDGKDITEDIMELATQIIQSRPSMAPLINTIGFLIGNQTFITKKEISERLSQFSDYRKEQMESLRRHFSSLFDKLYTKDLGIMLISHSSTINTLFLEEKNRDIRFYVLESRPLLEGRNTAEFFSNDFKTNLIVDSAMGKFMKKIDIVLVGIDSILHDGSIVNKIGTYPLAVLAFEHNKRVYAVGDSFKYNLRSHFGQKIKIEKKSYKEIYKMKESRNKNDNLQIHNYYFDITPPNYITGIVSDIGIHSPSNFLKEIKKHIDLQWFTRFI